MTIPEKVCDLAVRIANDDSHGYSQSVRWGPDFDCSSLVIWLWTQCGVDVKSRGATYTGNMMLAFLQAGFRKVDPVREDLRAGDVLLNVRYHTALYIGNGKMVHAAGSETGGKYGQPGDQTGREICIVSYYDFPWDYVLRYEEKTQPAAKPQNDAINYTDADCYETQIPMIKRGSVGPAVAAMQAALQYHGFYHGQISGVFDANTETALLAFQRKHQLEIDGICGPVSWNELSFWR